MNDEEKIKALRELLSKYRQGECNPDEERAIEQWFNDLIPPEPIQDQNQTSIENLAETIFNNLKNQIEPQTRKLSSGRSLAIWIGSIAACLILMIWAWSQNILPSTQSLAPINFIDGDVLPGTRTAILTDSEGESVRTPDPNLSKYASEGIRENFNLSTPVAATYSVQLEDGTLIWLNAESTLTYPSKFDENERRVQLIGEAYFDVKTEKNRPFIIEAAEATIEVLGTTFNISAYQKEVITTLVEGSLKIHSAGMDNILKPGEQAWCHLDRLEVSPSDLKKNLAWHRGEFYFDGSNLGEVCQQISRWYDVDFEEIDHNAIHSSFKGSIDRNQSLSKVLNILSAATGKQFEIQGRKVIADLI